MDLNRALVPVTATLAAATATGLAALARKRSQRKNSVFRETTGGCTPDVGHYVNARILVHDVDGTNQGIAIAMLRDRFLPAEETAAADLPDDEAQALSGLFPTEETDPTVDVEYDATLRACVEVAINLALEMGEAEIGDECSCGDPDCDASEVDLAVLHLVAGKKLTEFALSFERFASNHATECRLCAAEGHDAPGYLRAQFCRDLADDLVTNFDSDQVNMRGVPIAAALDVIAAMVEVIEQAYGTAPEDQINRLARGVAGAIAHKEAHAAPQG